MKLVALPATEGERSMRTMCRTLLCLVALNSGLLLHGYQPKPGERPKPKGPTADEALKRLVDGNRRFVADQTAPRATYQDQRAKTAGEQHPFAIILTCADSRVAPELVFNQQLGELFTLRVAGNVTDPPLLASIEYATEQLHPPLIVVMGHSNCGAVQAKIAGGKLEGNLGELLKRVHIGDKLPADKKAAMDAGVEANVRYHANEIAKQSKTLRDFITAGRVKVAAAVYSLETGEVTWLKLTEGKK